ncbi:phosphate ABC transporter substrate-binding protein [Desulfolucanica intricata]|uniref:phosphate ABC transporter substrate-binding protein n=1 Tax=Desulfolucanica intricata TaxID=1285191 RepID=UPI00082A0649|nr:phosphate ABC transporter substrate-binding protein [Desulfolucanica intricata]
MLKKLFFIFLMVLVVFLQGCSFSILTVRDVLSIKIAGSTSMLPITEALAQYYQKKHPEIHVNVLGGDSTIGMQGVVNDIVDISALSRTLTPSEQKNLNYYVIAKDELYIIVHPQNPITKMKITQVQEIYNGKITNWRQLGGPDQVISVIAREEGSGTHSVFKDVVMSKDTNITEEAAIMPSTGAVKAAVARDRYAIGYISSNYLSKEVKTLIISHGNQESESLARSLVYVTKKQVSPQTRDFLEFATGAEAQNIITNLSRR